MQSRGGAPAPRPAGITPRPAGCSAARPLGGAAPPWPRRPRGRRTGGREHRVAVPAVKTTTHVSATSRKMVKKPSAQHPRCRALLRSLLSAQRSKMIVSTMGVQRTWRTAMWHNSSGGANPRTDASAVSVGRGVNLESAGAGAGVARGCKGSSGHLRSGASIGCTSKARGAPTKGNSCVPDARSCMITVCDRAFMRPPPRGGWQSTRPAPRGPA